MDFCQKKLEPLWYLAANKRLNVDNKWNLINTRDGAKVEQMESDPKFFEGLDFKDDFNRLKYA